jgi:hypothetical protein
VDDNTMAVAIMGIIASGLVLAFLAFPVGRALADRMRGAIKGGATADDMKQLREEVRHELDGLRHDMGELAERVDFAERLLAKQREAARLGRGEG